MAAPRAALCLSLSLGNDGLHHRRCCHCCHHHHLSLSLSLCSSPAHSGIDCFNFSHEAKKLRLSKSSPLLSQYYHNINSFRNDFCYSIFAFFYVWGRSKVRKLENQSKSDKLASNFQNIVQKGKTALIRIFLLNTLNLTLIYHKILFNNTF